MEIDPTLGILAVLTIVLIATILGLNRYYRVVDQGQALVRIGLGREQVSFGGIFCFPLIHRTMVVDLTSRQIVVRYLGEPPLISRDGVVAHGKFVLYYRVRREVESVRRMAEWLQQSGDASFGVVETQLRDALDIVVRKVVGSHGFAALYNDVEQLRFAILAELEPQFPDFMLDDVAIDHFARPSDEPTDASGNGHLA